MRLKIFLFLLLFSFNSLLIFSQSYNDGPISVDVKLREVQGNFAATDESLLGVGFAPDELVVKIWAMDNLSIYPWTGGSCLQDNNFTPTNTGTNSIDFNNIFASFVYNSITVPQYLDFRLDTWEDDLPSDGLAGFCSNGSVCDWNGVECCGVYLWGLCVGIETGDDYRCEGNPFYQGLNYRNGPPCQWYSHGYLNGSCSDASVNGYFKPHIETYWKYTNGHSFTNAINLGNLNSGNPLIHFNSNECYSNYYPNSSGNDVIYKFNISNPTGVNISLCGTNGAQFDSYLYLLKDTNVVAVAENDNYCSNQSELVSALCESGTYYIVVDAATASELGTFTLVVTEDPSSSFSSNSIITDVSCYSGNDGEINLSIYGGYPPYTYNWYSSSMIPISIVNNTNSIVDSIDNLSSGNYIIQVIDNTNCIITDTIFVDEPSQLVLSTSQISNSCYGYSDGQLNVQVSGGNPPYSYNWNTIPPQNSSNAVYVSAGNYLVTVSDINSCIDTSSQSVYQPSAVPVNISSSNTTVCFGGSVNLTASGALSYNWSPSIWLSSTNSSNVISTPNTSIDYIVTGTDINGCSNNDTVSVSVVQSLSMSSTPINPTICEDEEVTIILTGATTYNWFPNYAINSINSSSFIAFPDSSTNYMIIGTDNYGCSDTIYIDIDVLNKPTLNLTNNPTICEGQSVSLSVNGANNYQWYPSTGLNNTIGSTVLANPSFSTFYSVIGTANNGCSDTMSTTVSVNPIPVLSTFPNNIDLCLGDTVTLYVSGADTYIWSPNQIIGLTNLDTIKVSPISSTIYSVLGIDNLGCSSSSSISVNVNTTPNIEVNADKQSICIGESALLSANGGVQYSWQPNISLSSNIGNVVSASPNVSTTYLVTGTDINSCSSWDTITILVNQLPVLSVNKPVSTICEGETDNLIVSGANNYIWSPALGLNVTNDSSVIASPNSSTNYYIIGTDQNGCSAVISSNVIVNPSPNLSFNLPSSSAICYGSSLSIEVFGANSYTWSPANGLDNINSSIVQASPLSSTTYTVLGTDLNNCSDSLEFELIVGVSPIVSINPSNPVICEGESITLLADGASNYQWFPDTDLSSSVGSSVVSNTTSTRVYYVIGTDILNCVDTSEVVVSVIPLPTADIISGGGDLCSGDSAAIVVDLSGNPEWNLTYSIDGAVTQISTITSPLVIYTDQSGLYTIPYVSDDNGCANVGSGSAQLEIVNSPKANISFSPSFINMLDPEVFFTNSSIFALSYLWDFGDNSSLSYDFEPTHQYQEEGSYIVTMVAQNASCIDTAVINVIVNPYYTLFVPNTFTPNNDGVNDIFKPIGKGIDQYEIVIYNRWGDEVFRSNDINIGWDGGEVISGTYTYKITIEDKLGEFHNKSGFILLE